MKHHLAVLLFVSLACVSFGQNNAVADKPKPKAAPPAATDDNKDSKPADYSQEAFVIEKIRASWRFENDGTGKRETTVRVKVQSDAGVRGFGQLVENYNSANEKLEVKYVRVTKPDGKVVTAGPDAVQDLSSPVEREAPMYSDLRQKHIIVPGLQPGDTLEYQILLDLHTALAPGNFWTQYDFNKKLIVLDEQFEVNVPRARQLKLKTEPGFDPKITDNGERRVYLWSSSNLSREDDDEDQSPAARAKKRNKKKKESDHPAVQLSTFTDWQEVGKWYADLERQRRAPNDALQAKARALTTGRNSDMEKIEALYDYVAKNFRYISLSFGLGRYQPHAAADVLSNEYGDCKDKHTLLASLLTAAGYKTNSVLINSSRKLDPDVPSPSQFDHVITQVVAGKDIIWMDTTTEVAPFRMLAQPLRNKQSLVIPQDGAAELQKTPTTLPFENLETDELTGTINDFGKLSGSMKLTARGDSELLLRSVFRRVPKPQWKLVANAMLAGGGINGEVDSVETSDVTATREPMVLTIKFSAPNFIDWSKKNETFALPIASYMRIPDEDTEEGKTEPFEINGPFAIRQIARIDLPKHFTVRLPLPISMKREYAEVSSSYKMDGQTIIAERQLRVAVPEIPREKLREYSSFARAVTADHAQVISLENLSASDSKPTIPEGGKAEDLFESAEAATRARRYDVAIPLYKKVVELDPKHKFAWNNLGLVQYYVRQYDAAITSLKKAIENDAYDQWAYNNLGRVYWAQHKYDDAAKAFNQQIEVSPLDRWAHANLGQMWVEHKAYKEAVPELEKAMSITPDAPGLYIAMGQAQLGLGNDDKAMAAFDKAVELAPSPVTWNNVAYELAKNKAHLDRARRYAESAVSSMAAMARNLDSSAVGDKKLAQEAVISSLSSYWDTLGWVYFQEGKLDSAEKYIRAAWALTQHGEVADHLGQIAEKRGDKTKAAEYYAAALAAIPEFEGARPELNRLVSDKAKSKALIDTARQQAMEERTIHLTRKLKENISGEFDVIFSPGTGAPDIAFSSGSDRAKDFVADLRTAKYDFVFPDDTPTRVVRHGVLSCSSYGGSCMFVLVPVTGLPTAAAEMMLSQANPVEQEEQGSAQPEN